MRFSRNNVIISKRCGEFYNSNKYFNFINNKDNLTIVYVLLIQLMKKIQPSLLL